MNERRRPTVALPHDFLDEQVPFVSRPKAEAPASPPHPTCVRATFHLPYDLVEECRDTVVALSGPPHRMTMAKLLRTALRPRLKQLRDEFNKGERFPRRAENLLGGRPLRTTKDEKEE